METRPRRAVTAAGTAVAGLAAVAAAATTLGGFKGDLRVGAGAGTIASCDADGLDVRWTSDDSDQVTTVIVSDIDDPECDLAEVSVTLSNGFIPGVSSGGPVTNPADDDDDPGVVTLSMSPTIGAGLAGILHVVAVGP